jgi:hypothetical protein
VVLPGPTAGGVQVGRRELHRGLRSPREPGPAGIPLRNRPARQLQVRCGRMPWASAA